MINKARVQGVSDCRYCTRVPVPDPVRAAYLREPAHASVHSRSSQIYRGRVTRVACTRFVHEKIVLLFQYWGIPGRRGYPVLMLENRRGSGGTESYRGGALQGGICVNADYCNLVNF